MSFNVFIGNWCFSLCRSPTTGLIFWDKCAIWSVQVRLSFSMMPRKLTLASPGGGRKRPPPKVFFIYSLYVCFDFNETLWLCPKYSFATFFQKKIFFGNPPGGPGGSFSNPNFTEIAYFEIVMLIKWLKFCIFFFVKKLAQNVYF